jgi:hypothetical protein
MFCTRERAAVELSVAMRAGDPFAVPGTMPLCAECHRLLTEHLDDDLARRMTEEYDGFGRTRVIEHVRQRTVDVRVLPGPSDAVERALEAGYVLLSAHTGAANEIGAAWPDDHRLARSDLGETPADEDDDTWMVSSPWPSLTVGEVVDLIVAEVERREAWGDDDVWTRVGREVFTWDEPTARRRLAAPPDQEP